MHIDRVAATHVDHVAATHTPDVTLSSSKGAPQSRLSAESIAAAVLFREILKPLANGLGPVGEIALASVADDLFARRAPE
jgi:hypothetical protein